MKWPVMRRATWLSCSGVKFCDGVDGERRRAALHDAVGQVLSPSCANASSRIASQPAGDVRGARGGEVPREVEVAAGDAGLGQRREQVLHVRAARVGRRRGPVAVGLEGRRRADGLAVVVDEVAQRDDVAVTVGEVLRRVDHQVLLH